MKRIPMLVLGATCVALSAGTASAEEPTAIQKLNQQAARAAQESAANTVDPNEINNIERRRILMGKAGLIQYVVFLSKSGQPIDYFAVDGKCTSSEKRLTPPERLVRGSGGEHYLDFVVKAPSEDGTYGSSSPYIYCKTTDGKYKQWNGQYYVSDSPIELTIKPVVVDAGGRNQQQQ